MINRYCTFFTFCSVFSVFIFTAGTLSAQPYTDSQVITVPPGGYSWSVFSDSSGSGDFTTVAVLAPGPIIGLSDLLPDSAAEAIELCADWLRDDLCIRFTDLLYEAVDEDMPVLPAFSDVNGDGLEDLVWSTDICTVLTRVFLAPDWIEITEITESMELRKFCDLNNDGAPDSVFISDEGVLTLFFEDTVSQVTNGFDITGVAGTALGDMEGDGLADLLVGTDSGNLLIYRNRGTIDTPCFMPFVSQSSILFPMNPGAFSSPAVFLSGDSMLIAAIGTQQNGLKLYTARAVGSMMSPEWVTADSPCSIDTLLNISPIELDLRGETVLVCGTRNGILCEARPDSDSLVPLHLSPVPGIYPNLALASVNGDEFPDLVAGTMEGDVFYLAGYEGWFDGNWERIDSIPLIPSGAPAAWKDGLIFGSSNGELRYFARDGNGVWIDSTANSEFCNIDVGEFSTPDFADINGDGLEELIVGNSRGSLTCFELDEDAASSGPLYVERFSWKFEPNGSVSDIQSYYSRYFVPYSVFSVPSAINEVNALSREILKAEPQYRDEIAYCIAHTPTAVLRAMYRNGDSDLFSLNVSEMYEMAEKLDYVRLLDSGDETVCELKTETGWMAISRNDYYRFVVHPRILFEIPARINTEYWSTERDTASISLGDWLNHEPDSLYGGSGDQLFWREFIPSDSSRGRPLEERVMEACTYEEAVVRICNFQSHSQPGGLMTFGYMTNDLHPMEIYRKAYGSCGEQSILQTALCRTFFIPAYVVGCRGEDHQWNQYLNPGDGKWNHWDINYGISGIGNIWVSGEGVNHTGKTISTITAFGPDNEVWPVTGSAIVPAGSGYMPQDSGYTCTANVDILVTDPAGIPVEGAMVLARSHWENANSVSEFNYTDESGSCVFQLGWEPNGGYTIDVISPFGSAGSTNITFDEGESYSLRYTVPCRVPQGQSILLPESGQSLNMSVTCRLFPVPFYSRSLYSIDNENGGESYRKPGWVHWSTSASPGSPVYMNAENFRNYRNGLNCRAVPYPFTPEPNDTCYAILDNRNSFFTWSEFEFSQSAFRASDDVSYDVFAWLAEPPPDRNPVAASCLPASTFPGSEDNLSWIMFYQDIELNQDDPDDPLSSERIIGPFRIPSGERSLTIGTTSDESGLDLDLFLFSDRNANRIVDSMAELAMSSTSPTSNETIFITEPDSSAAYWIYLHGWQVDEEGGMIDLGLSFVPQMLDVYSLTPTGYQQSQPERFSFMISSDTLETGDIYLLSGDDVIVPEKSENRWFFKSLLSSSIFDTGSVQIFRSDGELIENLAWNVSLDSIPPEFSSLSVDVDSTAMEVLVEALCTDEGSGILEAVSFIDILENTRQVMRGDSILSCRIDIAPLSGQTVSLEVCFTDSAGNETIENVDIHVPSRPAVLFSSIYPSRTVYDHRPFLQLYADFRDDLTGWSAVAELSDSSGTFREDMYPIVIDGNIIQFRPQFLLEDGSYTVIVRITDQEMLLIAEHSLNFCIDTMTSAF